MTKKRTMNELRQTKDTHYVNPTFKSNIASDEGKKYLDVAGDEFMLKLVMTCLKMSGLNFTMNNMEIYYT